MNTKRHMVRNGVLALLLLGALGGTAIYAALFHPLLLAGKSEIVRVEGGEIEGLNWRGLSIYRGIPFTAPPVGALRWRAPQPVLPWRGVRDATRFADVCMQSGETVPGLGLEPMSEDCLYLNVWSPAETADERLPVMVWLYGGGHHVGSGSARLYWGDRLARKGVIIVTLNYRLGAFGMMAHPQLSSEAPYGASGNYLLLDQIAALEWVRENIAAFGGDPDNVTLFGQSAGATSISRLIASPRAEGLFARAIAQSGGDLRAAPETIPLSEGEAIGVAFAEKMGIPRLAQMRTLPAEAILANDVEGYFDNGTPQGPHRIVNDNYVLPVTVADAYARSGIAPVPLLVGYNSGDDREVHQGTVRRWTETHAATGNPVYAYYFTRVPPYPPFRFRGIAGHGAELIYLFGFPPPLFFYAVEFPWNAARDAELSDQMISYWTNFAKTGNPNGNGLPEWPAYGAGLEALEFGSVTATLSFNTLQDGP